MEYEYEMYDEEQDLPMKAQSSALNEELGQIEYVFSDKTGTLTRNVMEFKKFVAGGRCYEVDMQAPLAAVNTIDKLSPLLLHPKAPVVSFPALKNMVN